MWQWSPLSHSLCHPDRWSACLSAVTLTTPKRPKRWNILSRAGWAVKNETASSSVSQTPPSGTNIFVSCLEGLYIDYNHQKVFVSNDLWLVARHVRIINTMKEWLGWLQTGNRAIIQCVFIMIISKHWLYHDDVHSSHHRTPPQCSQSLIVATKNLCNNNITSRN